MSDLTDSQKKFYEEALQQTKQEIQELEGQIQEELGRVKEKIANLQVAQKAARQMYDAACQRLGIPNDLEGGRREAEFGPITRGSAGTADRCGPDAGFRLESGEPRRG